MKNKGYKKFYKEIFDERCKEDFEGARYVECERTGTKIYESEITVHHFSHKISKGARPDLIFDKTNVEIVIFEVHGGDHASGKFNNHLPIK